MKQHKKMAFLKKKAIFLCKSYCKIEIYIAKYKSCVILVLAIKVAGEIICVFKQGKVYNEYAKI